MKVVTAKDMPLSRQPEDPFYTALDFGKVYYRLGRHYCKRMQQLGQCNFCHNCRTNVLKILGRASHNSENIRDPYAVLVWAIREEVAAIAEQNEKPSGPATDWLGRKVEKDPFEMFTEALE